MDHKWLEDFVMLARERSFSRAALLRHVTQPQFSRRIRSLEMWVGADLINRAGVPIGLTPAGEELLPVARRAVDSLSQVRARLRQAGGDGDWVTLATGRTLSRTTVPAWSRAVRRALGDFRLRILTGSVHDGVQALTEGGADFLLSYTHPRLVMTLDERQFESRAVGRDELVPVCAPRPDGKPQFALPGTLRKPLPLLGFAHSLALAQIFQDGLTRSPRELHLQLVCESDFAESLHEQALLAAGVAWLPHALVAADLKTKRLVLAGQASDAMAFEIRLHRPKQPRNAQVRKVWELG
jgi:LysR family transcriptional regulator, hypochlorite-specific transcription factor HypT